HVAIGLGGSAEPFLSVGNVVHHSSLSADRDLVADLEVTRQSGLPGHGDVVSDLGAARDPGLAAEDAVFAKHDVVAYLDEVIDLASPSDDGGSECGAVDGD